MQMQREDLVKLYQTKRDDELFQLAADAAGLTPEAYSVLKSEFARRRIDASDPSMPPPSLRRQTDQRVVEQPKVGVESPPGFCELRVAPC